MCFDRRLIDVLDRLGEEFPDHADRVQSEREHAWERAESDRRDEGYAHDQFGHRTQAIEQGAGTLKNDRMRRSISGSEESERKRQENGNGRSGYAHRQRVDQWFPPPGCIAEVWRKRFAHDGEDRGYASRQGGNIQQIDIRRGDKNDGEDGDDFNEDTPATPAVFREHGVVVAGV